VLRHAKAAPHGPDDHGRPLAGKGRRQGADLEAFLRASAGGVAPVPRLVLSSSAQRAIETAELVLPGLGQDAELVVDRRLYGADPDDVIDVLREVDDDARAVMVVGHNPTLHDLALELVSDADAAGKERLEEGFPTGALAAVAVTADRWAHLEMRAGTLMTLFLPGR
jgi:phosphohistidine phosphatase